jgi:lipopolysaccharide biosynthesis regulator YciM
MSPNTVLLIGVAAVVVVAAIGLSLWWRRKPEPPENPYVEALTLLVDGERTRAFEKLQAAVRSGFAPTDAYIRLGKMLRENGDVSKALQIHKSLTVKSDLTRDEKIELFVNIAEDYSRLGRPDQAVSVLESAVRSLNLRDGPVYSILARESHRLGRTEDAYRYLRDLKKVDTIGDREIALYLATAGAEMAKDPEKLKDARRTLHRAVKHDEDCAPAHLALGDVEERDNNEAGAIEHWRRAAVLSPKLSRSALNRLGKLLFERGTFSEIERVYREVLEARPDDEYATLSLASFYRKQGRIEDAIEMLEEYRASHPRSVESTLLLTGMYAASRDTATLERFLDENETEVITSERYVCSVCGRESETMRWHCVQCSSFDSYVPEAAPAEDVG